MYQRIAAVALAAALTTGAGQAATFGFDLIGVQFTPDGEDATSYEVTGSGTIGTLDQGDVLFDEDEVNGSLAGREVSFDPDEPGVFVEAFAAFDGVTGEIVEQAVGVSRSGGITTDADGNEIEIFSIIELYFGAGLRDDLAGLAVGESITSELSDGFEVRVAFDADTGDFVDSFLIGAYLDASGAIPDGVTPGQVEFTRLDDLAPIPLPASALLLLGGLGGLAAFRRKR